MLPPVNIRRCLIELSIYTRPIWFICILYTSRGHAKLLGKLNTAKLFKFTRFRTFHAIATHMLRGWPDKNRPFRPGLREFCVVVAQTHIHPKATFTHIASHSSSVRSPLLYYNPSESRDHMWKHMHDPTRPRTHHSPNRHKFQGRQTWCRLSRTHAGR